MEMKFSPLTVQQLSIINAYHQWFNEVATNAERKGELAYLNAVTEPIVNDLIDSNDDEQETSHYHRITEDSEPAKMKLPGQN